MTPVSTFLSLTISQFSKSSETPSNSKFNMDFFVLILCRSKAPVDVDMGNYNRKDKSLGELSRKLLVMFGKYDQCSISLDVVTQQLGR